MEEQVILVDEHDEEIGVADKLNAHRIGHLHRAISVFVFDTRGRLLLQRRAAGKYHSGGLWSNTCCSHPRPGESSPVAAQRRLWEEMGFGCDLTERFSFVYRAVLSNQLIENEYDHVFFGRFDGVPVPNRDEADDWMWMDLSRLRVDLKQRPDAYTFWLAACFEQVLACLDSGSEWT